MFGRRKRRPGRSVRGIPRRVLAPVEEIVEQGLLVADVAVRMNVKNAIIMNALRNDVDYDADVIRDLARTALTELADERERDAKHIKRMRNEIRDFGRSAWSESEYGNDDNRTLRHRQEVYETLATQLRDRAANDEYLTKSTTRARDAAWEEVGDSLKNRAEHPYYSGGHNDEYREEREGRIQQLIAQDLTLLMEEKADAEQSSKRGIFRRKEEG